MTWHAYLFEAKSIQQYLFESNRLRDIVGGSELVETLTGPLLDQALAALDLEDGRELHFSRRAGGSLYAVATEAAHLERFAALWTLLVQQVAPGMRHDSGHGTGDTPLAAFASAREALRADNSRSTPWLPAAPPVAHRSRRTGGVVVEHAGERDGGGLDPATRSKKRFADASRTGLTDRVSPSGANLSWRHWPRNLEPGEEGSFPFRGEERTVALLHADGNGLGQLLRNAGDAVSDDPDRFVAVFRTLSEQIRTVTEEAVRSAVDTVLLPEADGGGVLPARPIVVGGDDITFLVRADLALPFLRAFSRAFEEGSRGAMEKLAQEGVRGLPDRMTVGAGIVYMRASQPFYLAAGLVESLTGRAKRKAKALGLEVAPGSVAFHRMTTSLAEDYGAMLEREHMHRDGETRLVDVLEVYGLEPDSGLPALDDLLVMQAILEADGMARGPTRQLLTLVGLDPAQARRRYRRWHGLMADDPARRRRLRDFEAVLERLAPGYQEQSEDDRLPFGRAEQGVRRSPLVDVTALMAVGNRLDGGGVEEEQEGLSA